MFDDFVGHEDAKLALILNAIDIRCGGVLFIGEKGSGKTTLARLAKDLLPQGTPFVNLPLNVTEDALLGGIDMERTLRDGKKILDQGLLDRAGGGVLYIDDINLLSPEITALILREHPQANIFSKESPLFKQPANFLLMGSMNPEEGPFSPHFLDRFGMCIAWESLKEPLQRIAVMKWIMKIEHAGNDYKRREHDIPVKDPSPKLKERIMASRITLDEVAVSSKIQDYVTQQCIENGIAGHRGDIFLYYAARAFAAYSDEKAVTRQHVDAVLPLVLIHRKTILQKMEEKHREKQQQREKNTDQKEEPDKDQQSPHSSTPDSDAAPADNDAPGPQELPERPRESAHAEEAFEIGQTFKVKRLAFRKDRMNRTVSGRRTKTGARGKRGRHIRSILRANDDVAIDATIRAAAPFQRSRGRAGMILIRDEDLRFKQREKKMGHLVILVVDGSGSMGAQKRMVETKGAVQSLLMDCYHKRDMVSMIVFRKDHAEVVLPPTASVTAASKKLRDIPVGGKTPLAAGLWETFRLIKRVQMKSPETRFLVVLITDGRANQSLSEAPAHEETTKMAALLSELRSTDYVVMDTEDKSKFIKTDLALEIASTLGADYYRIDDLKAGYLADIVKTKKMTFA